MFFSLPQNSVIIRNLAPLPAFALLYAAATQNLSWQVDIVIGALHALCLLDFSKARQRGWLAVIGLVVVALAFTNIWLLAAWISMLVGMSMGRAVGKQSYLILWFSVLELALLLAILFFLVIPQAGGISSQLPQEGILFTIHAIMAGWAILLLASALIDAPRSVEPVVCVLSFLLCLVTMLAISLAYLLPPFEEYLLLVIGSLGIVAVLASLSWLIWHPYLGEGIANLFFRHLMALSMPLEEWLEQLSRLADEAQDARQFWFFAMDNLVKGSKLSGLSWVEENGGRSVGEEGKYLSDLALADMNLTLFSNQRLLPTETLNLWLLARLALEHRQAKERQVSMANEAHMRSIHELGARTTHDLKNLLQAITLICSQKTDGEMAFTDKKKEQLLLLASRLETTLTRLKGQSLEASENYLMPVKDWWEGVKRRNDHDQVTFVNLAKDPQGKIPAELFDRALENLLHNALRKQGKEGLLDIEVKLGQDRSLTVSDNGADIPAEKAERLFNTPLPSSEGMGIGLYQLALGAAKQGYRIYVSSNSPGDVAITLEKD